MNNQEWKHRIDWWVGNLEDKTTAEIEAVLKAAEVILRERDQTNLRMNEKVKNGNSQRGNEVGSGLQAA